MKKSLSLLINCFLLLQIAGFLSARPLVEPVRSIQIPYACPGTMIVDGLVDARYSAEQSTFAFNTAGSTGSDADFTLTFKVAYNEYYLYLFARILDDFNCSIQYTTDPNPWT